MMRFHITLRGTLLIAIFVLAAVGFADASYLTIEHYSGKDVQCIIFEGCDEVLSSHYSVILGVPVSLLGMIYYAGFLFLMLIYAAEQSFWARRAACALVMIGLAFSAYFVYLQLIIIRAICFYCMLSAGTTALLAVLCVLLSLLARHRSVVDN